VIPGAECQHWSRNAFFRHLSLFSLPLHLPSDLPSPPEVRMLRRMSWLLCDTSISSLSPGEPVVLPFLFHQHTNIVCFSVKMGPVLFFPLGVLFFLTRKAPCRPFELNSSKPRGFLPTRARMCYRRRDSFRAPLFRGSRAWTLFATHSWPPLKSLLLVLSNALGARFRFSSYVCYVFVSAPSFTGGDFSRFYVSPRKAGFPYSVAP